MRVVSCCSRAKFIHQYEAQGWWWWIILEPTRQEYSDWEGEEQQDGQNDGANMLPKGAREHIISVYTDTWETGLASAYCACCVYSGWFRSRPSSPHEQCHWVTLSFASQFTDDTRLERERAFCNRFVHPKGERESETPCGKGSGLSKGFLGALLLDFVVLPDISIPRPICRNPRSIFCKLTNV
jgi:hypothetical protein